MSRLVYLTVPNCQRRDRNDVKRRRKNNRNAWIVLPEKYAGDLTADYTLAGMFTGVTG